LKADVLVGNGERNSLNGNAGADVLKGMGENDSLNGGDDNDKIFGGPGDESISNGPGSDQMFGESGDDTLYAGSTADGRDVFSGGVGDDRIDYSQRTNPVVINVKAKNNDGEAGENDDVRPDFETLISGSGNDVLTGDATPEYFYSGGGDDTISGGGGSDRAFGGAGLDTLTGNEGYDYLYGESDNDTVFIDDNSRDYSDGGPGFDTLYLDEYDSHTGFEALVS
jgi:Ca2+-binding RTX toxin-like protein